MNRRQQTIPLGCNGARAGKPEAARPPEAHGPPPLIKSAAPFARRCRFGRALAGARITGEDASGQAEGAPPGPGGISATGRQPGPLPEARQRTGVGRCRHAVSPAPSAGNPRRHTPPVTASVRANRVVISRQAAWHPRGHATVGAGYMGNFLQMMV